MNNFLSYCGLTDSRMKASEKDLPVNDQKLIDIMRAVKTCQTYAVMGPR